MYMQGFKCTVTGAKATHSIAPAVPAAYCKDDASACVKGAKQMIVFNQAEGNNVPVPREARSPGYNAECGFLPGAQKDIFVGGGDVPPPAISSAAPAPSSLAPSSLSVGAAASAAPSSAAPVDVELPSSKPPVFASIPASVVRPAASTASTLSTLVRPVQTSAVPSAAAPGNSCGGRRN